MYWKIELKQQYDFLVLFLFIVAYCLMQAKSWYSLVSHKTKHVSYIYLLSARFSHRFSRIKCSILKSFFTVIKTEALFVSCSRSFAFSLARSLYLFDKAFGYHIVKIWINLRPKRDPSFVMWRWCFIWTNHIDFPKTLKIKTIFPDYWKYVEKNTIVFEFPMVCINHTKIRLLGNFSLSNRTNQYMLQIPSMGIK